MTTNELYRELAGADDIDRKEWIRLAAEVLGCPIETVEARADTASFIDLGGTSLRAADFAAQVERQLGIAPPLRALRAAVPLARAMAQATAYRPVSAGDVSTAVDRPLLPSQDGMLLGEDMIEGRPVRVIFTAESATPFDPERLRTTLAALTRSHEALRTTFTPVRKAHSQRGAATPSGSGYLAGSSGDAFTRRVLPSWEPRLLEQRVAPPAGGDAVAIVHRQVEAAPGLLQPFHEPPILFIHTRVEGGSDLLTVHFHHALMDGWALNRFWQAFARAYASGVAEPGPSPELIAARHREISGNGQLAELTRLAVEDLAGLPETVPLPVDRRRPEVPNVTGVHLPFGLSAELRSRVEATARQLGMTHTVVVCSAWAMAVGRRAGLRDLAIGVAMSGREVTQLHDVLGLCVRIVPVRFQLDETRTVAEQLRACAASWSAATERSELPFEEIILALGQEVHDRTPIIEAVFEAHDELVGDRLRESGLDLRLHEGFGGSSMMETTLFLTKWGERPSMQLEYQPAVFRPDEAIALIDGFTTALEELVTDMDAPVSSVRTIPAGQRQWLEALADGPATDCEAGLWHLFEETAELFPDEVAVDNLTYDELLAAVRTQAAALADVRPGDRVMLALPRGVAEVVAVLAALHRGATYVAVDEAAPRDWLAQILRQVSPVAVIGSPEVAELAGRPVVEPWTPAMPLEPGPEPAPADPGRTAYIAFTSGSTGQPKGVPVPHRAVVRLVRDVDYVRQGPGEQFLRAAPLAFDASTFELFGSLLSGAGLQILPDGPVAPTELARFLIERKVTVAFLTTGLFRLMADHRPEAFAHMRQVITGGEVTPPQQVRRLLEQHEGLRVSHAYGPTECTTFTTIHHFDSPAEVSDPLPIGRPVPGTRVFVLDDDGRAVPPGAIGELCVGGVALADGYLDRPEETARAFGAKAPDTGEPLYRTGDLVRWDGRGHLIFVGRRDQQLKVRGFRVEPEAVARRLREHPQVRDAVVVGEGKVADQRLIAGVIPDGPAPSPAELRAWVGQTLPAWAVPELWSFVEAFPLTKNAKVDLRALAAHAAA